MKYNIDINFINIFIECYIICSVFNICRVKFCNSINNNNVFILFICLFIFNCFYSIFSN